MKSLSHTLTFLTQLFGFVDSIYEKFHLYSRFTAEQAWTLTTQILDRICEDLYAPKEGVVAIDELNQSLELDLKTMKLIIL